MESKQDALHEECGVFGAYAPVKTDLAALCYYGLFALQHRGQESAGIVLNDQGRFAACRETGLVRDRKSTRLNSSH